ncbi:RNA-binding cell elongation regulator Jag/EloR [Caloranaerobacter ferrireducens]|uniref:RNA-binding cell elongation regulator Jag/EloR n=1 Tax=Caloranaerobacter ferrireducens TaxID=1323370 RepID=UPI00084DB4D9|nr:RNA-binding cell elongation regulator Jag/EloR [Caloranaerobacter ferrireducens]
MKSIVKTAKTIDDAVREALLELGADRDDVLIKVLEEPSKGFLGLIGGKDAKVEVTVVNDPVEIAGNFLKILFKKMKINASTSIRREGKSLFINIEDISDRDMGILIGKRGKTLDSVQYLVSLIVNKERENYIRVFLDINNYRKKREETLIRLAEKMAFKVKRLRRDIKLEPMNPNERRIIHSTLQNNPYVETFSEGEEPFRRVVISYKKETSKTQY